MKAVQYESIVGENVVVARVMVIVAVAWVVIVQKVLDNIGGREYVREGRDFPDGEHDDALDAHEMAWRGLIAGGNL